METATCHGSRPKRVLLKLSGEALSRNSNIFDRDAVDHVVREITNVSIDCELGIVIGGGNIFRGSIQGKTLGMEEERAHYVGMLATIVNGEILRDRLKTHLGERGFGQIDVRLQSKLKIDKVAEPFIQLRAVRHLEKGRIVIFSGGTGNPFFTTDTAMTVTALEIKADLILKGTKVDGIFDCDPATNPDAVFIPRMTHEEYMGRGIDTILDRTAVAQAQEHNTPIRVFNIFTQGNLKRVIMGEDVGSLITSE
jgi:uridylate kinase